MVDLVYELGSLQGFLQDYEARERHIALIFSWLWLACIAYGDEAVITNMIGA